MFCEETKHKACKPHYKSKISKKEKSIRILPNHE